MQAKTSIFIKEVLIIKDEIGNKYGRLQVISYAYTKNKRAYWHCICDCGNKCDIMGKYLRNGDTTSCGCRQKECYQYANEAVKKHNSYYIEGDIVHVIMSNSDMEMLCDIADWDKSNNICWYLNNTGYARGTIPNTRKMILFHNYIITNSFCVQEVVDHINGNRLDNRRCNLRICSTRENSWNKGTYQNNKSGHTGIYFDERVNKPWFAYIQKDKTNYKIGAYDTYKEAVTARENAEKELFGEYRRLTNMER